MAEKNGITSGTGQGMVDFFTYVASKGLMNRNSAGALRAAAKELLSVENGNLSAIDVRELDVESLTKRFANLRASNFTPKSLVTYQSRFRTALEMYKRYLQNPAGWRPEIRERPPSAAQDKGRARPAGMPATPDATLPPPPSSGMIQYPFPIRKDVIAHLTLPSDLARAEAKRLAAFVDSLAVDEPKALTAGTPPRSDE